ncbi:hypothetical protein LDENG_00119000 [Lucifuga dentata]|nr:hypothetical protein LDENG_00119000 [Lucifuga dentata]
MCESRKPRVSPVWEHFDLIFPMLIKCLLCSKELGYNNNTSSMLRLNVPCMRAGRRLEVGHDLSFTATRKQELDEALVSMIVKDNQPLLWWRILDLGTLCKN